MKIAVANNYYYLRGGSERVMFGDQDALRLAGHDVRPFAPKDARNEPADSSLYFPEVQDAFAGSLVRRVKAASNLIYSTGVREAMAHFLDDFPADVIHCHNIYGRLTTAILDEARLRGIPVVMTVHDLKVVCPSYLGLRNGKPCHLCVDGRYWRCVRSRCHKNIVSASVVYTVEAYFNRLRHKYDTVSRFLCPSEFVRRMLISSGISPERAVYQPNALPIEVYSPSYRPGEYMLYAGRLSAEKGLLTLLRATAAAKIPLKIAGTGPLESQIKKLIAEDGIPATIEGYCSGSKLAELYRKAAFSVIPSEWYENAPMSVLEAFAYGKPVLGARIGGIPELVKDGTTGKLFSPGNVEELASAATAMWSKPGELIALGQRARELVEERFSIERRIADLIATYLSVGNNPGKLHPVFPETQIVAKHFD